MNRQEFGCLVALLRKEQRNEFDEVMSQYDLAEKSGIPLAAVQKIEQGRQVNLKPAALLNLSRALNLSARTREAFLLCASGLSEKDVAASNIQPQETLRQLRDTLEQIQTPAFITDCFGDVLFVNPSLLVVYHCTLAQLSAPYLLTEFNIIRILMAPEFAKQQEMMGKNLHSFLRNTVLLYKAMTIKYRPHWYFQAILPELNRYPLFREHWQSPVFHDEEIFINYDTVQFAHPLLGNLRFLSGPLQALTPHGDLNLYSFQPLDAHTLAACAEVAKQVGTVPIALASWPKKRNNL